MGRVLALAVLGAVLAGCIGSSSALCTRQASGAYVSLPNATVWNQDIMAAFGSGFRPSMGAVRGQEGHWLSALITGTVLTGITVYALVTPPSQPISYHYFCIAMYTLFTGIVEFARFNFDASRFGFLTASWHNLWEYQIIAFLLLPHQSAKKCMPWILLFVWVLNLWIMFAWPFDKVMSGVYWASLPEQLTGICADWVLVVTMLYLWLASSDRRPAFIRTHESQELNGMFRWGALAAAMHMAEIIPLVFLLAGLTPRPYLPISVLVALTSPITFVLYTIFAKVWNGSERQQTNARAGVDRRDMKAILAISILIGLSTILGPIIAIPDCTSGQPTATGKPELSALTRPLLMFSKVPVTNYATPEETAAAVAARLGRPPAWPETHGNGGAEKLTCPSRSVVRGVTVVTAKPGYGDALRKLVSPMAYPVRKEEGSQVWDFAYDGSKEMAVVTETWSNIRTMLKHVYISPTVRRVFYSREFAHTIQKQNLKGPLAAMLPCSEVAAEPEKLDFAFEATLDVQVDCAWNNMKNWTKDFAYVRGAKSVTPIPYNSDLRILHMAQGFNITVLRQPATSALLPPVDQPAAGYRFVYYVLDGGFVPNIVADYVATVTIEEDDIPSKTLFTYHVTATPAAGVSADTVVDRIPASFGPDWLQFLQDWAGSLNCNRRNGVNGHRQVATAPYNETRQQQQDDGLRALPPVMDSTALAGYAHTEL